MPDEDPIGFRGEQPPIPVGTAVNLSRPNGRELLHALTPFKLGSPVKWKGRVGDAPRGLFLLAFECSKARGWALRADD
jgi:hypothetical protein